MCKNPEGTMAALHPFADGYVISVLPPLSFITPLSIPPISGQVDRASSSEAVESDSIPGRVKPKTIKIGIHSFPA